MILHVKYSSIVFSLFLFSVNHVSANNESTPDYDQLREKITFGKATFAEVRQALTEPSKCACVGARRKAFVISVDASRALFRWPLAWYSSCYERPRRRRGNADDIGLDTI